MEPASQRASEPASAEAGRPGTSAGGARVQSDHPSDHPRTDRLGPRSRTSFRCMFIHESH